MPASNTPADSQPRRLHASLAACRARGHVWLFSRLGLIGAGCLLVGCQTLPWSSDHGEVAATAEDSAALTALDDSHWVLAATRLQQSAESPAFRWRHPALETLHDSPALRNALLAATESDVTVRQANAAILLARWQVDAAVVGQVDALRAAIGDAELSLPLRQAAAEALGHIADEKAHATLCQLIDELGLARDDNLTASQPEIQAELIRGLAQRPNASADPRILAALAAPFSPTRQAALAAWSSTDAPLPSVVLDLRHDVDPGVRAAALRLIGRRNAPAAEVMVAAALTDADWQVRRAAIATLGAVGGKSARLRLARLVREQPELVRAEAVAALSAADDLSAVCEQATDKSWTVRLAVAKALANHPVREALSAARDLARDPNPQVQQQVAASMAGWPLEQAGVVLLDSLESGGYAARKEAAEQLHRRWSSAGQFPAGAPQAQRTEALASWRQRFLSEYPQPGNSAASALSTTSPEAGIGDLPQDNAEVLSAIAGLESKNIEVRRRAANRLAGHARDRPLSPRSVARLAASAQEESDATVYRDLLACVADDSGEPALGMALAGLSHQHGEVRRRSCEHLARHGARQHAAAAAAALSDDDPVVVRAAVAALGRIGRPEDATALEPLTASADHGLRLEAAVALCRLGAESGSTALERLAHDADPDIRRRTAIVLGDLADTQSVALLVEMLDDRLGVEQAALASLEKTVGRDVAANEDGPPPDLAERIDAWKRWARQQRAREE